MSGKVLNIMLAVLFGVFCIVFAVKTVLIQMKMDEEDAEWEANRDNVSTSASTYVLIIDENYNA